MFWRRAQATESLPWYRDRGYKGNLTAAEKGKLDAARALPRHPAARYDDLPEEVQTYIAKLELEAYDLKQDWAASKPIASTAVVIVVLSLHYFPSPPTFWMWAVGLFLLIVPWFVYRREWNKNAKEFNAPADEAFKREWEINDVASSRARTRGA
jgi:hypothetical protein